MLPEETLRDAEALIAACRAKRVTLATVESCTGGLIAVALTSVAGASDVVDRGFVAYSNQAKHDMLGVPMLLITQHGAVSEEVARAMASGALEHAGTGMAVAVTGFAGPGGGSLDKPVGLVCFGLAERGKPVISEKQIFAGDRAAIRAATVAHALGLVARAVG